VAEKGATATGRTVAPKRTPRARAATTKRAATATAARKTAAKRTVARRRVAASAAPAAAIAGAPRMRRRTKVGMVISAKQRQTVTVSVGRQRQHPLYKKVVRLRKRFAAHDEAGEVRAGDLVRIEESRPYSATKRWRVVEVLSRAGEAGAAAPPVSEVEKALERAEGVDELLAPAAKPEAEASAQTAGPEQP